MFRGKQVSVLLVLVAIALIGSLSQGCVTAGEYKRMQDQYARTKDALELKDQRIEELDHEVAVKQEEILALKEELGELDRYRKHSKEADELIAELRGQLEASRQKIAEGEAFPDGVTLFKPQGEGVGIRVEDRILFDSGSENLKAQGTQLLDIVADQLVSGRQNIRIVGHTDSDPVVKTAKKWTHGNIQLSSMRAISVYEYLKKKGVPEKRMCVVGYGPNRPLVDNTSTQNKQKNRRVEIILTD